MDVEAKQRTTFTSRFIHNEIIERVMLRGKISYIRDGYFRMGRTAELNKLIKGERKEGRKREMERGRKGGREARKKGREGKGEK